MKRILVIGCPGSGKSTFSKKLAEKLNYPLLHLDRIFHIDNENHVTREELKSQIKKFINNSNEFIIDGNYSGTLPYRLEFADTVFYFNIDSRICLDNVMKRSEENLPRDDIAPGFDNSIIDPEFIEYVKDFDRLRKPVIEEILEDFEGKVIQFYDYDEIENFLEKL